MSYMTHCGHGIHYSKPCEQCEVVWVENVVIPAILRGMQKANAAGYFYEGGAFYRRPASAIKSHLDAGGR